MTVLIVRLGSLGDIVHALPVAAALKVHHPAARIDWLVDVRYRAILEFVPVVDRCLVVDASGTGRPAATDSGRERFFPGRFGLVTAVRELRRTAYDVAIDLQGLLKSAVLARMSAARRVLGFSSSHLRERAARFFYTEHVEPAGARHVVDKNLSVLSALGIADRARRFPIDVPPSTVADEARARLGARPGERFAVINPGGGWPNKQWPPERFGAVAAALRDRHAVRSVVTWGPGERALAERVVAEAGGAAALAPDTSLGDLIVLLRASSLVLSGDTGPIHLAAAAGTPVVGLYGPTDPVRNGPWGIDDETLSQYEACVCHYQRRCRRASPCLHDITVNDVLAAIERRLAAAARRP